MKNSSVATVVALSLSSLLSGCFSPGFQKAWSDARPGNKSNAQRWEGRWESCRSGVGGRMRAVLSPQADGHVRAYFEARWKCFLTAYEVSLNSSRRGGVTLLSGDHLLNSCVGGGLYTYKGTLSPLELRAAYDSHHDKGTFHLEPSVVLHPPCSP